MPAVMISHSTPQATAQPGRPTKANTTVPKVAQIRPQTLSQKRARRGLRAVVGSLPVRIEITAPPLPGTLRGARSPWNGDRIRETATERGLRVRERGRGARKPSWPTRAALSVSREVIYDRVARASRLAHDAEAMTLLAVRRPFRTGHEGLPAPA